MPNSVKEAPSVEYAEEWLDAIQKDYDSLQKKMKDGSLQNSLKDKRPYVANGCIRLRKMQAVMLNALMLR